MRTYSSGKPRVHVSTSLDELVESAEEYESWEGSGSEEDESLKRELRACAVDLREEIEIRKTETWR